MHEERSQIRIVGQDLEAQRIWARREARSLLFKSVLWFVASIIIMALSSNQNMPFLQFGAIMTIIPCIVKGLKAAHLYVKFLR